MEYFSKAAGGTLVAAFFMSLLGGCTSAPVTLYSWGTYQNQLYARFKANSSPEQQIQELEKNLENPKVSRPLPPGYHAHLGLLYGEVGRVSEMYAQFRTEKQLFPESAAFMDFLLSRAETAKGKKE